MFKASEARALAKSKITTYLAIIELRIKKAAERGEFHISLSGGVTKSQADKIVQKLEDAGYFVIVELGSVENLYHFYISWAQLGDSNK